MRGTSKTLAEHMLALLVLIRRALFRAVDFIYPPCCPFCDNKLKTQETDGKICRDCQKKLVYITNNHCMKCGKQIDSEHQEYCYDCSRYSHYYDQSRAVLSYQGNTKEALYRFKKMNRKEYASFFGAEICRLLGAWIYNCKGHCLVPVPMYYKNESDRGYNQALLLAKVTGKSMGIPVCERLLVKVAETRQQKDLDRGSRRKNLEKVFRVNPEYKAWIKGKRVILLDDIYTTGATVDAAAKILKEAGAARVFVLTVAIGG